MNNYICPVCHRTLKNGYQTGYVLVCQRVFSFSRHYYERAGDNQIDNEYIRMCGYSFNFSYRQQKTLIYCPNDEAILLDYIPTINFYKIKKNSLEMKVKLLETFQ
jgi:hypothetical protein